MKFDIGFYGKGLDSYIHYKQEFDRTHVKLPYSRKPYKKNKLSFLEVLGIIAVVFIVILEIVQELS